MYSKDMMIEVIDNRRMPYSGSVLPALDVFMSNTYLLQVLAVEALEAFEGLLSEHGINARQYLLLGVASTQSDLAQVEIANHLGVDATVLGKLLQDLETRGFLERRRVPEDRRRHELTITASGASLLAKAEKLRSTSEDALLEKLSNADKATLRKLLRKAIGFSK